MRRVYFDYAASTPVDPRVLAAMRPYLGARFGNPGSLHSFGQEATAAVDRARETLAGALGAEFREVVFTGSATEANNLALRGVVRAARSTIRHPKIVVSAIEHESVLETARDLVRDGVEVVVVPVDRRGVLDAKKLERALDSRTVLVSVMYANNEIGTIQPVAKLGKLVRASRAGRPYPLFHTDAAQAFQFFDCRVNALGVDLMTLSAHKMYGPKGVGALYVKDLGLRHEDLAQRFRATPLSSKFYVLSPITTGGGQEFGLRSATENVSGIAGFAEAVRRIETRKTQEAARIRDLRDRFLGGIRKIFRKAARNGSPQSSSPHIANIHFPGIPAEELLLRLDMAGIAASAGSACRSRSAEASHVIEALGHSKKRAKESIRFSFGRPTTERDVQLALSRMRQLLCGTVS